MIHPPICWLISPNVGSPNICGIFKPQIRMIPHVSSEVSESLTPRPAVRGRPLPAPKTPRSTSASPEPPAPAACASSGHQCMATTWDRLRRKECGAIGSTGAMGYKKKGWVMSWWIWCYYVYIMCILWLYVYIINYILYITWKNGGFIWIYNWIYVYIWIFEKSLTSISSRKGGFIHNTNIHQHKLVWANKKVDLNKTKWDLIGTWNGSSHFGTNGKQMAGQ